MICLGTYKTIEGSFANILGQLVAATILYFIGKHIMLDMGLCEGCTLFRIRSD